MTQENVTTELPPADVIDAAFDSTDPEVRKLPLDSPNLNAALEESQTDSDDGDDDDAPAGDDENEQEIDDGKAKKKPRARDRRIDQLTAKIGELQRSLEQRETPREKAPEPEFKPDVKKPKITEYSDLESYTEAMTEWKLEVRDQERAHKEHLRTLEKQAATVEETWNSREKEVVREYNDYNDVVSMQSLQSASPSNEARLYLGECDDGPRVLYNLLSDSEQAEKFASASPVKQVAILAKIEASLGSGSDVKKYASKAPEPPRSLPSGKAAPVSANVLTNAHEMSFEEWDRQVARMERNRRR